MRVLLSVCIVVGMMAAGTAAATESLSENNVSNIPRLDCSTFNASKIRLVTFDAFAALFNLYSSLDRNVPVAAPVMTPEQVKAYINHVVGGYGSYEGKTFNKGETRDEEPFVWVGQTSNEKALAELGLSSVIPGGSATFQKLTQTWSDLIPWAGTSETIAAVARSGRAVGPLSNGDADTLAAATSLFQKLTGTKMDFIFSSNYPVGAFKPQGAMYAQLLSRTSFAPDEILHVAGAPNDAQGARTFGLYSGLTWNYPSPGLQPCFRFSNITDVLTTLEIPFPDSLK